jgi:hypothetical protein
VREKESNMAYESLREFIEELEAEGELVRVRVEVDPILEISEITDRISKAGGPALLFERVRGSEFPVVINLFGSEKTYREGPWCASAGRTGGAFGGPAETGGTGNIPRKSP